MATIQATPANFPSALQNALDELALGNPTTLECAAGRYEHDLKFSNTTTAFTIICAGGGEAIFTGSNIHADWTDEGAGEWSIPWTFNHGIAATPSGWPATPDEIKRRECVWVDNQHFYHVLSRGALVNDTMFVDEAGDKLYIKLSGNPNGLTTEVAYRTDVCQIQNCDNVTLQDIVIEKNADGVGHSGGCWLRAGNNNVVDTVTFRRSGWGAFSFQNNTNLIMRDCLMQFAGGNGLDMNSEKDISVIDCIFEDGNHRGDFHGWNGWSVALAKWLLVHGLTVTRCIFRRGKCRGLWLDTDIDDTTISNCKFHDCTSGSGEGLHLEVVQGPITVQDCEFWNNEKFHMHTANVAGLTYVRNKHYDAEDNTWFASGDTGGRTYTDFETSVPNTLDTIEAPFVMQDNIWQAKAEVGKDKLHYINSVQAMTAMAAGTISGEQYFKTGEASTALLFEYQGNKDYAAYIAATGESSPSYSDPEWVDPANGDFTVASSPPQPVASTQKPVQGAQGVAGRRRSTIG